MAVYRVVLSALCGAGLTALIALSLNLTFFPAVLLFPAGIPIAMLSKSHSLGSTAALLAANTLLCSAIFLAAFSLFLPKMNEASMRLITIGSAFPVGIFVVLACVPRLSPLWPQGMAELADVETGLRAAIPLGTSAEQARTLLKLRGIEFQEEVEKSQVVVLQKSDAMMEAAKGDRLISGRLQTNAGQFPCNYEIDIFLLFGENDKLQQQYIHRRPICP